MIVNKYLPSKNPGATNPLLSTKRVIFVRQEILTLVQSRSSPSHLSLIIFKGGTEFTFKKPSSEPDSNGGASL